jgi:hypothetical protein
MANGITELFQNKIKAIEKILAEDELTAVERVLLESQSLLLTIAVSDHKKIDTMWVWFRPVAAIAVITAGAIIMGAATGHVHIDIMP